MKKPVLFSPMLFAMALFPAFMQVGTCSSKSGNPDLLTLEIEAGGLDRLVGFDTDTLAYSVWLDGAATFIVRGTAEDSNTAIGVWMGSDYDLLGNGSGEMLFDTPADGTVIVVQTKSSGNTYKSFQITVNPACSPGDCDDASECTSDVCNTGNATCEFTNLSDGTACDGSNGGCQSGICVDNCTGVDCSDGNPCTQDVCDSAAGGTCSNPPEPAGALCDAGGGPNTGQCDGFGGCPVIDPMCLQAFSGTAPTACRSSFDPVSTFPLDMTVALDRCVFPGQPFNATVTPTMIFPKADLQPLVDTLCATGTTLTEIQVDTAQALIDAFAGANCTPALSELSAVPQVFPLDVTVVLPCGAGNDVVVNAPLAIPLPPVSLTCVADTGPDPVAFCADGTTPVAQPFNGPPVDTFIQINAFSGALILQYACGGPATTNPAPGSLVSCTDTNANGGPCGATVGTGDFGETPFPTSDCNFGFGFPGRCEAVPIAVDPTTACVTLDACAGVDCSDGNPCTQDVCDAAAGGTCSNPPAPGPLCDAGGGPDTGQCDNSGACAPIDPSCLQPVSGTVPTACRNSFDQRVGTVPVDLTVAVDRCLYAGQPFDATVTPAMALDMSFLDTVAQFFCDLGIVMDQVQIDVSQASIDALAGATCTPALSELSPAPQILAVDVTVTGTCGAGGTVTVDSAPLIPLPQVVLSCIADSANGPAAFCADGTTPLNITLVNPPVETFVGVTLGGGAISAVFQCGGATTIPNPGATLNCTTTNADGGLCGAIVGTGNSGEMPFPTSDCNFSNGFPGECEAVPVALDPATDCITFPIACVAGGCDDGNECTSGACNTTTEACEFTNVSNGTSCDGGNGSCQTGVCTDNCDGVDCSDGSVCTQDVCDSASGGTCSNPPGPAGNLCDAGGGPNTGQCDGLGACPPIDPLCLLPVSGAVPTACRSSFNNEVLTFPVDMTIALDRCVYAGQPFDATVTPTMTITQEELDDLAQVFCGTGTTLDEIRIDTSQALVDALVGANCTPALSELSPVPQIVPLDITVIGAGCGAGGGVTVDSPVFIPLPPVAVACVADAGPGPVAFCADGTTPGTVLGGDSPVDTYIEIVTSFFIDYACSPGVASADAMSIDPIDPAVDCITFPFTP